MRHRRPVDFDDDTNRKQIVATTVYNVYGLVDQGLFDERLYYRPNVVLLNLGG